MLADVTVDTTTWSTGYGSGAVPARLYTTGTVAAIVIESVAVIAGFVTSLNPISTGGRCTQIRRGQRAPIARVAACRFYSALCRAAILRHNVAVITSLARRLEAVSANFNTARLPAVYCGAIPSRLSATGAVAAIAIGSVAVVARLVTSTDPVSAL